MEEQKMEELNEVFLKKVTGGSGEGTLSKEKIWALSLQEIFIPLLERELSWGSAGDKAAVQRCIDALRATCVEGYQGNRRQVVELLIQSSGIQDEGIRSRIMGRVLRPLVIAAQNCQ